MINLSSFRVSRPADAGSLLMKARGYLNRRHSWVGGNVAAAPQYALPVSQKRVTHGLFTPEKGNGHDG